MTGIDWALALAVAFGAGAIKGVVGFAMPLIMISGLSSILPPEMALAGLILPTLITNLLQAFRQGVGAAWRSVRQYQRFLLTGLVFLLAAAPLVRVVPGATMTLLIGVPVFLFALASLAGRGLRLPGNPPQAVEFLLGALAGFFGGISGVWGPPLVAWLSARNVEKRDAMRVLGVTFLLGAIALFLAHLASGVLNAQTLPFSAAMVLPALLGMALGRALSDRFDQAAFRRATFIVLMIAGANLIRRGLIGL